MRALLASFALCAALGSVALAQDGNDRARTLFQEGTSAYQEGDFGTAAEKFVAAYRLTRSPELAFNAGRAYERMSEYDKAIRFFRIYLRRGDVSDEVKADIRERIEALRQAKRRQRDQVFTLPPSDDALVQEARTFFQRGVAMFRRRQYEAAMQAFTAAHRFAPLPEIFFNMAVTAEKMGNTRDAMDYYREYLRLRPRAADRGHVEREIARLRASR
jgi:tetratricopeptide (TPR) repeat protein